MTSMLSVFNIHVLVLFNTGTSYSFISSGETRKTKNMMKGVKLMVNDQEMETDLYVI